MSAYEALRKAAQEAIERQSDEYWRENIQITVKAQAVLKMLDRLEGQDKRLAQAEVLLRRAFDHCFRSPEFGLEVLRWINERLAERESL